MGGWDGMEQFGVGCKAETGGAHAAAAAAAAAGGGESPCIEAVGLISSPAAARSPCAYSAAQGDDAREGAGAVPRGVRRASSR